MKNRRAGICVLIGVLALSLLGGCSLWRYKTAQAPKVTVVDVQLAGFSIFEQKFDVSLRLQNPNDFALPITGMAYGLSIEDNPVAHGVSDQPINLPAFGEQVVTVSVAGNLMTTLAQLQRWRQSSKSSVNYSLQGRLKMAGTPGSIPFAQTGDFTLIQDQSAQPQ